MTELQLPSTDHEQFDAICAPLADWEHLPAVVVETAQIGSESHPEDGDAPLDGRILAGLIAPY